MILDKMTTLLPHISIESGKQPRHTIIWLHGLGADGHDFVPIAHELSLPVAVRYIFPHAPQRPVTINGGFIMRAWYDISGATIDAQQDEVGIRQSQADVEAIIRHEVQRGVQPNHIILGGFSQGGAIALHTMLRQNPPLGGAIALSAYLPLLGNARSEALPSTRTTPIFLGHGRSDPVVPIELGISSRDCLVELGYSVGWHEYTMQHSVCDPELRDLQTWLCKHLEESDSATSVA